MKFRILSGIGIAAATLLASCGPQEPIKPTPPPVVVKPVIIPQRPYPPMGSSPNYAPPPINAAGQRQTVNTGISQAQTTWNLRSAFNVAALNCMQPQHAGILEGYKAFLIAHRTTLGRVNTAVDTEFRARHGAAFVRQREAYMTQVYNYYAFPNTLNAFCDASLAMSQRGAAVKSADLGGFATAELPQLDMVFENFYRSYEQYRRDLAAWDARYAPPAAGTGASVQAQ